VFVYQVLLRDDNGKGVYDVAYFRAFGKKHALLKAHRIARKRNSKYIDMDMRGTVFFVRLSFYRFYNGFIFRDIRGRLRSDRLMNSVEFLRIMNDDVSKRYVFRNLKFPYKRLLRKIDKMSVLNNVGKYKIEVFNKYDGEVIEIVCERGVKGVSICQ
jgi:hypothetical protein